MGRVALTERVDECERGESRIEVGETGFVVICPFENATKPDSEGVDSGQRLKVVKVG